MPPRRLGGQALKKFEKKQPLPQEHDAIDLSPQQNEYYEAISERCGLVQVFLYLNNHY